MCVYLIVYCFPFRNIHYPPETCNIMLLARMIATVKQVTRMFPNFDLVCIHYFKRNNAKFLMNGFADVSVLVLKFQSAG